MAFSTFSMLCDPHRGLDQKHFAPKADPRPLAAPPLTAHAPPRGVRAPPHGHAHSLPLWTPQRQRFLQAGPRCVAPVSGVSLRIRVFL